MATHLIDKSAWVRLHRDDVDASWVNDLLSGRLAVTGIGMIELLQSAIDADDFGDMRLELDGLPRVAVNERIVERAIEVQSLMVRSGTHRAPSTADLVLAACAEANGLAMLHYDKDFDLIASVTGQPTEWLAPAGTLD